MLFFFFFNDTATTEIYTLSLHDALPISPKRELQIGGYSFWNQLNHRFGRLRASKLREENGGFAGAAKIALEGRSEEHTSELQSQSNLVCRLLLEKKKTNYLSVRTSATTT